MFDIKLSIIKALKTIAVVGIPLLIGALGFTDITILDLLGKLFPILGSLTVSGLLAIILNYLKVTKK